jgi:hypothetical protein
LTRHVPSIFSAVRTLPWSSSAIVSSTAARYSAESSAAASPAASVINCSRSAVAVTAHSFDRAG